MRLLILCGVLLLLLAGCINTGTNTQFINNSTNSQNKNNQTTLVGIYSEQYKGGPVIETNSTVVYLINFSGNSSYEGKTIEVTGVLFEDKENVVGPYVPNEPISQGWSEPRWAIAVSSFKIVNK